MAEQETEIYTELTAISEKLGDLNRVANKIKRKDVRDAISDAADFIEFAMDKLNE